ncbi:MAG: hypothetical protein ACKVP4_07300 [Hyphomicrobium sp.]
MDTTRTQTQVQAALAAVESDAATTIEKIDMLAEIAMGLQTRPKDRADLEAAIRLYDVALDLCPDDDALMRARLTARKGTAYQAVPNETAEPLEQARECLMAAVPILSREGTPEEAAEGELNLGLVLQSLASAGRARITDAISAYQRALRTFDRKAHPKEFAILQNNLATAFLSIPFTDERSKMREAMAVRAFEDGLEVVNILDHPSEYAMLQNNLGNALQYASSSHAVENNLRALEAYDEALKVRTRDTTPLEYANTLSNKANCLSNLPDDPEDPEKGNKDNLTAARALYQEAREIFAEREDVEKARLVGEALTHIAAELDGARSRAYGDISAFAPNGSGHG